MLYFIYSGILSEISVIQFFLCISVDVSSASECSDNESDDSDSRDLGGYRCQNCFVTGKSCITIASEEFKKGG